MAVGVADGRPPVTNEEIARNLDQVGELLAAQDAKPFRAAAYHRAAETVRALGESAAELFARDGIAALTALPTIGARTARAIADLAMTGRLPLLERLRGAADPAALLATVPGIGTTLAQRIHERLGLHGLEDLEAAAHDGRLAALEGFGPRRLRGVSEALAGRLRRARPVHRGEVGPAPGVDELLDVDREYREQAAADALPTIAPRRFNPERRAWLPILHTERDDRHYTVLFSNTARAHQLGRTHDWVVIFVDDGLRERQATVVTEWRGALAGRRVVRGREAECRACFARMTGDQAVPDADDRHASTHATGCATQATDELAQPASQI